MDEIENAYDQITTKAYQIFRDRHGANALDIVDWLLAEKQLLWKPDVQMIERRDLFIVTLAMGDIDPRVVDILATTEGVLVQSPETPGHPRMFRAVHFSQPINHLKVYAVYAQRKLILVAPKMAIDRMFEMIGPQAATRRLCT